MIKITPNFSEDFLRRYKESVILGNVIPSLNSFFRTIPNESQAAIKNTFSNDFVEDLILGSADALHDKIQQVYERHNILSERYCLEYCLKDVNLSFEETSISARSNHGKGAIFTIKNRIILDLRRISKNKESIIISEIINDLDQATEATTIKSILKKILKMKQGNHSTNDAYKSKFPDWVNNLSDAFNYNYVSKIFGYEITKAFGLNICPYCNNEDIETITAREAHHRPDLDHFYPKSKFPFLSVSLSNLIPSGGRCNRTYKSTDSMLGYVNPQTDGINQNRLFDISYFSDEGLLEENIKIETITQSSDLDKNIKLFKVRETHNRETVKVWLIDFIERRNFLLSSGTLESTLQDSSLIKLSLGVDLNRSPKKENFQKFQIDVLNSLTNKNFSIKD